MTIRDDTSATLLIVPKLGLKDFKKCCGKIYLQSGSEAIKSKCKIILGKEIMYRKVNNRLIHVEVVLCSRILSSSRIFFTSILCKKLRAEIALFNLLSNYDDVDLQFFGADRMFE